MTSPLLLTDCVGLSVRDAGGRRLGRVADLEVEGGERYPRVVALHVRRGRDRSRVAWQRVERMGPREVVVRPASDSPQPAPDGRLLLLRRDVLDAQVVDLAGKRLARVGDVELSLQDGALRVAAVDVGLAAVVRRLGLHALARRLREEWIGWDGIYLASGRGHRVQLEHRAAEVRRLGHDEVLALVAHLPPVRAAEVIDVARPGMEPDPLSAAIRAGAPRRRFRVMRARKRAPS